MQLQITAEEVFDEYKRNTAELQHELMLCNIKIKKLLEIVERYEKAAEAAQRPGQPVTVPPLPAYPPRPLEGATEG